MQLRCLVGKNAVACHSPVSPCSLPASRVPEAERPQTTHANIRKKFSRRHTVAKVQLTLSDPMRRTASSTPKQRATFRSLNRSQHKLKRLLPEFPVRTGVHITARPLAPARRQCTPKVLRAFHFEQGGKSGAQSASPKTRLQMWIPVVSSAISCVKSRAVIEEEAV